MLNKTTKEETLNRFKENQKSLEAQLKVLEKETKELMAAPVFEDSLQGQIETAYSKALDKIDNIIEKLEIETGMKYVFTLNETNKTESFPDISTIKSNLGFSTPHPFPNKNSMKKVVEDAVKYCINNGTWIDGRSLHSWISRISIPMCRRALD